MSSFGSAIVVDADSPSAAESVLGRLRNANDFDERKAVLSGPTAVGGLWRVAAYVGSFAVENELRDSFLAGVENGRALIADDFDDYGAVFTAWSVQAGSPTIVYRAIIEGPEEGEWSTPDRTGGAAVSDLAALFRADPAPLTVIDNDLESLADEIGIIGGPFPWFDALGVPWPGGG